jgi:hypothetical protein
MRLDHVSYAAGPEGLASTVSRFTELLGEKFLDGGAHPRFGTRNMVLPLRGRHYLEVVEVLDHPASDKAPFGQVVRSRSAAGGGWVGWVMSVDDITVIEQRLGSPAVQGNRHRPDGFELLWKQVGIKGTQSDPQLPFFIQWEVAPEEHPSAEATGDICLDSIEIAGDPDRVAQWVGQPPEQLVDDIDIEWVAPQGSPGVVAAHFRTLDGVVRI